MALCDASERVLRYVGAFVPVAVLLAVPLLLWVHTFELSVDSHKLVLLHATTETLTASSCFGIAALAMHGSNNARLSPALGYAFCMLGVFKLARLLSGAQQADASILFGDGGTAVWLLALWLVAWYQRDSGMRWVLPTLARASVLGLVADVFLLPLPSPASSVLIGHAYKVAAFGVAFGGLILGAATRDVRARAHLDQALRQLAREDALTGLYNRNHFIDELAQAIARASAGRCIGVLLLDLDNFKAINDNWGHHHGDRLLVEVASALKESLPPDALIARMGGDEFAVLLPGIGNARQAHDVALQVLAVARRPFQLERCNVPVGASVGMGVYPDDAPDGDVLMRRVDLALFHAKADGRGCARRFDDSLETCSQDLLELQLLLAEALAGNQFQLHYQPQFDASGEHILGFEALLRWQHPERGAIEPGRFIPVAEAGGMIVPIGDWVLEAACRQIAELCRRGVELPVAVNLSAHQLHQPGFAEHVSSTLARHGVPPRLLELELTESIMMRDPHLVAAVLRELDALGVRLAIDDFGTGYSSLAYLRDFPIHRLKIDRSFVIDLECSGNGVAIVQGVIRLAHSLGLSVLAEGVETERQQRILQDAGCDALQGWRFSPAVPESQIWLMLAVAPRGATASSRESSESQSEARRSGAQRV